MGRHGYSIHGKNQKGLFLSLFFLINRVFDPLEKPKHEKWAISLNEQLTQRFFICKVNILVSNAAL